MPRLDLTPAGFDQAPGDILATAAVSIANMDRSALADVLDQALAVRADPLETIPRRLAASLIVLAARGRERGAVATDNLAMFRHFAVAAGLIPGTSRNPDDCRIKETL